MNILKRNRERHQGQNGGLLRLFRKNKVQEQPEALSVAPTSGSNLHSRNGSVETAVETDATVDTAVDTAIDQCGSTLSQTLWDRAYDSLKLENQQLVDEYEKLLSKELLELSTPYIPLSCCGH